MPSRSARSTSARSTASIIPPRTAVEVFDDEDEQWFRGGTVAGFNDLTGQYTIIWGGDERTVADAMYVRRVKPEWHRVEHAEAFSLKAKAAPYQDWLEQEECPPPAPEPKEASEQEEMMSAVSLEPWIPPGKRNVGFPEWNPHSEELPPKKTPLWQKNINRYFRNQKKQVAERPGFVVTRKAAWEQWTTTRPDPSPKKESLRIQRYWGRFAPEEAFEQQPEDEIDNTPPPPPVKEEKKKKTAEKKKPAAEPAPVPEPAEVSPAEPEPQEEEQQQRHEEEAPAAAPVPEQLEQPQNTSSASIETTEEANIADSPAAEAELAEVAAAMRGAIAPPATTERSSAAPSPTSPSSRSKEVVEPPSSLPVALDDNSRAEREELFDQLLEAGQQLVTPEALKEKCLPLLKLDPIYVTGVEPARLSAKGVSRQLDTDDLNRPEFRVFLLSLNRYIALHDLYGNIDFTNDPARMIEPEEFEKAIPLLSKWGADMTDIEEAFGSADSESHITFSDFLAWAIKQGISECSEP